MAKITLSYPEGIKSDGKLRQVEPATIDGLIVGDFIDSAVLAEAVKHPNPVHRKEVIQAISRFTPDETRLAPSLVKALEDVLSDQDQTVRDAAAQTLQKLRAGPSD